MADERRNEVRASIGELAAEVERLKREVAQLQQQLGDERNAYAKLLSTTQRITVAWSELYDERDALKAVLLKISEQIERLPSEQELRQTIKRAAAEGLRQFEQKLRSEYEAELRRLQRGRVDLAANEVEKLRATDGTVNTAEVARQFGVDPRTLRSELWRRRQRSD
jgi:chromosome segregation ATPase